MSLQLSEEQKSMVATVREFAAKECGTREQRLALTNGGTAHHNAEIARASGAPETYPRRAAKAERPKRYGAVFRAERKDAIWLVRRPDKGLLGGMEALPTTEWRDKKWTRAAALKHAPVDAAWTKAGEVRHVFTHFELTLDVYVANAAPKGDGWWGNSNALPTVFKKAATLKAED